MLFNALFKILCTFSSLSIALWIYAVNNCACITSLIKDILPDNEFILRLLSNRYLSAIIFFALLVLLAYVCMRISRTKKSVIEIKSKDINRIEPAGEEVMLTYLGLFFYALSVKDSTTLIISFTLLCIGCFLTRRYSFNPLYLFFGYRYYNLTVGQKTILMISKEKIQFNDSITFNRAIKINEFTFIDTEI